MEPDIVCKPSAFKHDVTEDGIRWAFSTARYDLPIEGDEEKRLLIGFNNDGNPLEIIYNELDDGKISVFHAMPCRTMFISLLNQQEDAMKEMTDQEADYWDEYYTKNPPKVDPNKNGGFAQKSFRMVALDRLSEEYLLTKAIATDPYGDYR
jgi:hypothetical protein